jgi:hypothetical protein
VDAFDEGQIGDPSLVAVDGDTIIGWAAASPVSDRCASSGVVENSVYALRFTNLVGSGPSGAGSGSGNLRVSGATSSCSSGEVINPDAPSRSDCP